MIPLRFCIAIFHFGLVSGYESLVSHDTNYHAVFEPNLQRTQMNFCFVLGGLVRTGTQLKGRTRATEPKIKVAQLGPQTLLENVTQACFPS